jgi:hypothetical protein
VTLHEETKRLRHDLDQLAEKETEVGHATRYALRVPPPERLSLYRRLRIFVGRELRRLGLRRTPQLEPWLTGLRHVDCNEDAGPLVIWALGTDGETLRTACLGLAEMLAAHRDLAPVLITDTADFAFFSRLGWLVEYVPALSPPAGNYAFRKQCYLAWRYRDAPSLPISVGLQASVQIKDLLFD